MKKYPRYVLCTLHLHPENDRDIIRWLKMQQVAGTKTGAIRALIRDRIRSEKALLKHIDKGDEYEYEG